MIQIIGFDFTSKTITDVHVDSVQEGLKQGAFCWVDIMPEAGDDVAPLLQNLGVNSVAISETLGGDQEGRYDIYEDCLHFSFTEAAYRGDQLQTGHLDVLFGASYLVTFHRKELTLIQRMKRTYRVDFMKFSRTPGFLLYELADGLTDIYRKAFQSSSAVSEKLQLSLFDSASDAIFQEVSGFMGGLLALRKYVMASREVLHELATRRSLFISETTQPFLINMAGALDRLSNDLTTERDTLNENLNLYMGMVGHRTNKIVSRLTLISMIFLPLTFLCGVYGMNFVGIPELEWKYSYPVFWLLVLVISGMSFYFMKKRKWV